MIFDYPVDYTKITENVPGGKRYIMKRMPHVILEYGKEYTLVEGYTLDGDKAINRTQMLRSYREIDSDIRYEILSRAPERLMLWNDLWFMHGITSIHEQTLCAMLSIDLREYRMNAGKMSNLALTREQTVRVKSFFNAYLRHNSPLRLMTILLDPHYDWTTDF